MKKTICFFAIVFIFLISGCAGTGAQPIRLVQINDELLSCDQIEDQAEQILKEFKINKKDQSIQKTINVTAYITGQILLIPTLFMDVTGANQIERKALYMRLNRLKDLSQKKTVDAGLKNLIMAIALRGSANKKVINFCVECVEINYSSL